jgi:hypothetical protein
MIFGDDIMTPVPTENSKYGVMSLAVAQDSGWYQVDLSKAETYTWGKDAGCEIFDKNCSDSSINKVCTVEGAMACSEDHIYQTECTYSSFIQNCNVYVNKQSCRKSKTSDKLAFTYGANSVCLTMKVSFFSSTFFSFNLFLKSFN